MHCHQKLWNKNSRAPPSLARPVTRKSNIYGITITWKYEIVLPLVATRPAKSQNENSVQTTYLRTRAKRRFKEYKNLKIDITYKEVLKSLRNRDKSDQNRKYGPLKKTKDSILINTTKLSKKACFKKIKAIMDKKLNN